LTHFCGPSGERGRVTRPDGPSPRLPAESLAELHRSKPPPSVTYSAPMPEIETLMQEWPPEVEEALRKVRQSSARAAVAVTAEEAMRRARTAAESKEA
jgi:hypothetical protein